MDEFYTAGGKASHVLHVLDTSETKKKANDATDSEEGSFVPWFVFPSKSIWKLVNN